MTKVRRAPINTVEELPDDCPAGSSAHISLDEKLAKRKEKFIKKAMYRKIYKLMKKQQLSEEIV
jgi:hypothetical protein